MNVANYLIFVKIQLDGDFNSLPQLSTIKRI